jgi:3-oxoacyl-[acyl-carrier-protein] synthase-3
VFSLHSDGSGAMVMNVPYGGFRNQSCAEALKEVEDTDGSRRSGEQFRMDGMDVFNFGMKEEPKDIKHLLAECEMTIDQVDVLVYHQANKFMTDFFSKKLKIDASHTPYCLKHFGNTSSASIPLTIVSQMKNGYKERSRSLLSGFGAGLSWGSVMLNLSKCSISELIEY